MFFVDEYLYPIIVSIIFLSFTILFYCFWIVVLKRPCTILTDHELPQSAKEYNIHVVSKPNKLPQSTRDWVKTAFLKGNDFLWMATGSLKKTNDPEHIKNHRRITWYVLEYAMRLAEAYGHVLVCRDDDDNDKDLGVIMLIPPKTKSVLIHTIQELWILISLGIPPPLLMKDKDIGKRCFAVMESIEHEHETFMGHERPHYYVFGLAVADEEQGKGIGKKLLQVAQK